MGCQFGQGLQEEAAVAQSRMGQGQLREGTLEIPEDQQVDIQNAGAMALPATPTRRPFQGFGDGQKGFGR